MALPNAPQSRNERYLAKIAGEEVELPNEPLSREEQYLEYIAKNGGGGGGYVLPTATVSRLGGVKIGSGINVEEDGTISADIPTKVSDLDNDADFISDADYVHTDNNYDDTAKGIVNGVTEALAGKQDELTFDNIPTENSTNPVKSGGVYASDEAIRKWTTAEAKSVSGNPITLLDGSARKAEGLAVTCNPKQNLHGYDHPWAGGAGKNKLPMTVDGIKAANTDGSWSGNEYTLNGIKWTILTDSDNNVIGIKANGTSSADWNNFELFNDAISAGSYIVSGITGGSANTYRMIINQTGQTEVVLYGNEQLITVSSGNTIRIRLSIRLAGYSANNIMFYPMIRLSTVSDATFEPYSNECPITGYTECVVDRDGKNLFDVNDYTSLSSGVSVSDDAIKVVAGNYKVARYNEVLNLSAGNYVLSFKSNITSGNIYAAMTQGGNTIFEHITNQSAYSVAFTLSESGACTFVIGSANLTPAEITIYDIQIEVGSSATPYVPYSHDTATITLGTTVYGGTVNFKTGKVTVTHGVVDLGTLNWLAGSSNRFYTTDLSDAKAVIWSVVANMLCEIYQTVTRESLNGDVVGIALDTYEDTNYLTLRDTSIANLTALMSVIDGKYICYELATPIELTLTPAELELLKGYNYITTNGTTISLDYLPDSLLAEAENYVDDADSVLNAKIDEIDGRVDSIEAMSYHTDSSGTKTVTLTNVYQQVFISISIVNTRTIYLVAQQKATASIVETIFSTTGKTPIDIAVTHVSDNSFTITLPQYAQTNIFSTEPFSVK